jgi:IclR family KDG regulon transcriptional repressor
MKWNRHFIGDSGMEGHMKSVPRRRPEPAPIGVFERGLNVLDYMFQIGEEPLHQIAEATRLPAPTVHRLLHGLEAHGYVVKNGHGTYRLGVKGLWLTPAREPIRQLLRELRQETGESTNFSMLVRDEMEYVERAPTDHALAFIVTVGQRVPLNASAMGKAVLAWRPELWRDVPLVACTPRSITDRATLLAELETVRAEGYAVDEEEYFSGVVCVAVPVYDGTGTAVAALSVSGPAVRFDRSRAVAVAPRLMEAGARVSHVLGYRGEYPPRSGEAGD